MRGFHCLKLDLQDFGISGIGRMEDWKSVGGCLKQDNPPNPPYQGGRILRFSGLCDVIYCLPMLRKAQETKRLLPRWGIKYKVVYSSIGSVFIDAAPTGLD